MMATHMPPSPPLTREIVDRFQAVWQEAHASTLEEPAAMVLATADAAARPSSRTVLCRGFDERGFVFFTNLNSRKGGQLCENPHAALTFLWKPIGRQVHAEGDVEPVTAEEADAYWATRARASRIGAWASKQSRPAEKGELVKRVARYTLHFGVGDVPRPEFWSGFRIRPERVEFWTEGTFRLHEREVWEVVDGAWVMGGVFP